MQHKYSIHDTQNDNNQTRTWQMDYRILDKSVEVRSEKNR